ncbi:hypothetical protein [Chitinophaga sp. S165]|uniref:hypothetical protein n=1 Tax=Chitinophaga sp. S165 TaxID=2135462 RepID=UPI0011B845C7|nr:hypothetical protein [Chitinophaga sp. S165]
MNKEFFLLRTFFTTALLICVITLFYSCKKDGELMKATEVVNISITSFSTDAAAAFAVVVNDDVVEDSLYNGGSASKLVAKAESMQHIIIKDHFTDAVLIDTSIAIPGKTASLTLLQLNADSDPILVGQSEEDIPENHRLQAIFYTNDILPDSIGFQVYGVHYDPNTFELLGVDTLATYPKIKKGELSEFMLIEDNPDPSIVYYFFQPLDVNTQQALPNQAVPFDPVNYSGVLFPIETGATGTEKHYINDISATGSPEFFDITSIRLISY